MNAMDLIYTFGALPLQGLLLYLMLRHRTFKAFPFFFTYTVILTVTGLGRFALRNTDHPYFYFYWVTEAIYALLGIAVLHEVYRAIFGNMKRAFWFRALFPIIVAGTLTLTILRTQGMFTGQVSLFAIILSSEMAVRLLQVALFVVLISLVAVLGLRWRQHAFGISAGFGIYASITLFTSTKLYEVGANFEELWGVVSVVSYFMVVLIWLWYFKGAPEPEKARAKHSPLSVHDLQQYKHALQKVWHI
jgi:hypothetical protein